MSIGASSVPNDSGTPSPAASICSAKSLAPSGSSVPDAVPVIASLSIVARSMSTPPADGQRAGDVEARLAGKQRPEILRHEALEIAVALGLDRAALSVSWWRPSTRVITVPSTAKVPLPDQSAAGPLPDTLISTGGCAGQLQEIGDDAACRLGRADVDVQPVLRRARSRSSASICRHGRRCARC